MTSVREANRLYQSQGKEKHALFFIKTFTGLMGVVNKLVVFAVQSTERSWMTGATKPAPSVGDPGTMIMSVRHVARSSVCCATSAITIPPGFPYT